jgi:histidinol-phosphatase (PHP family)
MFDMMSHPDYWRRYMHNARPEPAKWEEYGQTCLEAIDALKSLNMGVEVNTSGRRHEHGVQYPIREFLEVVHGAGIRKVTIGSDSHTPDTLGYWLVEAVELLCDIGFKHITSFKDRKPIQNPIDSVVRTVNN